MKHLGNIAQITGDTIAPVNVIIGGSPCQDLSIAGKRAGLAGERSGLFTEQIRIVKEMRKKHGTDYPRFMVWENVPGALSSNKWEDFRIVLEETARIAEADAVIPRPPKGKWKNSGCIMGDGWSIAWRILDAQFWGVPQRRRRIALVADFGGESAPEILFEREGMSGNFEESGKERERNPTGTEICSTKDSQCLTPWDVQSRKIYPIDSKWPSLYSQEGGGRGYLIYDARENGNGIISPTLTGDHQNRVTDYTAICIQGNCVDQPNSASCNGRDWKKDVPCTLNTVDSHAVCMAHGQANAEILQNLSPALNCDHEQPIVMSVHQNGNGEKSNMIVRRLTPLECERLQGFPDGWTNIGDYIDSKGKKKHTADTARYRALGNSIALPPWRWVLKRLCNQYDRCVTMGSLFDGIGGFPLIWEEINGKGSCLWASEIEEFPIAVTKIRIGG